YREHHTPNTYIAGILLRHGADPNTADAEGRTPLMLATGGAPINHGLFSDMLAHGAKVEAKDVDGATPLFYAADDLESVRVLLAHGANVNATDISGRTPLMCTSLVEIARELVGHGADINAKMNDDTTVLDVSMGVYWRADAL